MIARPVFVVLACFTFGCSSDSDSSDTGDPARGGDPVAGDPVAGDSGSGDPTGGDATGGDPVPTCTPACPSGQECVADPTPRCVPLPPLDLGHHATYTGIAAEAGLVVVVAYNQTYGDLMVGTTASASTPLAWQFVDGVPAAGPVTGAVDGPRGGIAAPGADVGRYAAVALGSGGAIHVSYADSDAGNLMYALGVPGIGGYTWSNHVVDQSGVTGRWTDISIHPSSGAPAVTYAAVETADGLASELRSARAASSAPAAATDWAFDVLDSVTLTGSPLRITGEEGTGIHARHARYADGRLATVYFDAVADRLALVRQASSGFDAPVVLEASPGLWPSIAIDGVDEEHVAFHDHASRTLRYLHVQSATSVIVDNGMRMGGVSHRVGTGTSIALNAGEPVIVYQDAATHEVLFVHEVVSGVWTAAQTIAGGERGVGYVGAYGFYVDQAVVGSVTFVVSGRIDRRVSPEVFDVHVVEHDLP
jgi:hypothetical protein